MSRVFVSGSSEGLGLMAGQLLAEQGHEVVLHARNSTRANDARRALPQARAVVEGDVSSIAGARSVAEQVNHLGRFDAVIHNVGIGYRESRRVETVDGLPHVFAVNVVYLSSGMHHGARAHFDDLLWEKRRWNGSEAYAESKLYDLMMAFAIARRWPEVFSNALEPGWVATRMGGRSAPDDLDKAHRTQVWLAVSDDPAARVTGEYFYHLQRRSTNSEARNTEYQQQLIERCEELSKIPLPQ
jgi:NAD(P)-dependent dehydrogenase (short-subunit alcohol dehydrogenase family)